jgi:hypothetical protein
MFLIRPALADKKAEPANRGAPERAASRSPAPEIRDRDRASPTALVLRLRGDQQSDPAMSNILKTIDLTDRAIRRAVFAVLDGLAAEHRTATAACRSVALPALSVGNSIPNRRNDDAD